MPHPDRLPARFLPSSGAQRPYSPPRLRQNINGAGRSCGLTSSIRIRANSDLLFSCVLCRNTKPGNGGARVSGVAV